MAEFVFVLKVSKFCNLRCAYCYEHAELHKRERIEPGTLEKLFAGVDAFGDYLSATLGIEPRFSFVWHGGEPLLLPRDYYRQIAAMQARSIQHHPYGNSVQTNLYGVNRDSLAYVLQSDWELGVSIDFAEGVRRNVGGRDSNAKVMAAVEALHAEGRGVGVISVLGAHNRNHLSEAYDWVAEYAEGWRLLPIFEGGPETATRALRLSPAEIAQAFIALLNKRAAATRYLPLEPLDTYMKAAVLRILDQPGSADPARPLLDNIYVINANGDVFLRPFAYDPARCLGNLNESSIVDMLQREIYRGCQAAVAARKRQHCLVCEHMGFCDTAPMHEHGSLVQEGGAEACGFPRQTISALAAELTDAGVDAATIGGWAREWLAQPQAAAVA